MATVSKCEETYKSIASKIEDKLNQVQIRCIIVDYLKTENITRKSEIYNYFYVHMYYAIG